MQTDYKHMCSMSLGKLYYMCIACVLHRHKPFYIYSLLIDGVGFVATLVQIPHQYSIEGNL